MTDARPSYVHGTHPEEQRRLEDMNALINAHSLAALAPVPGERLIDFGSGLGQFARAVARVTGAPALGIERSDAQRARAVALAEAAGETALAEFRAGEATAPPLSASESGSFDIAHARFLLEHVPDPLAVVRAMAAAIKPGGRVVIEDDDHGMFRPWPEPPGVMIVWHAYVRTYDRLGNDPYVGRRLVQLLAQAGLSPTRSTLLPFGASSGDPAFVPFVRNLADVFRGARAPILGSGGVTEDEFELALRSLAEYEHRRDAALWYTASWAEARKP